MSVPAAALADICRDFAISRLSLFGSVLRDDFSPHSDIDILIEFASGRTPGFLGLGRITERIAALFPDRTVDVLTPGFLSRHFRDDVVASAWPVVVDGHVAS